MTTRCTEHDSPSSHLRDHVEGCGQILHSRAVSAFADYMVGEKWHESDSKAAAAMGRAVDAVIDAGGPLTPDIGGDATTEAMGAAVAARIGA